MQNVLLAGATGYLGGYLLTELLSKNYHTRAIARNPQALEKSSALLEVRKAKLTAPPTLRGICEGIDCVISSVGITRQKDGLTYMDVDYGANLNLLNEAKKAGVRRFIYISVLNGERLRHLKICEAKERFVDELKNSDLDYCIVRPNGFFSDIEEFFKMALKGRVYLFGDGNFRSNPVHGQDLAEEIVKMIHSGQKEFEIGGPQILSQTEIAEIAFQVLNRPVRITYLPHWIADLSLRSLRCFTWQSFYGPVEFMLTVLRQDMIAPCYGKCTLDAHFQEIIKDKD